jgi:hypothetical protein
MQHAVNLFARLSRLAWLSALVAAGCGGNPAPAADAGVDRPDAHVTASQGYVISGGGSVRAGAITLDVELGQPGFAGKAAGTTVESAPVIGGVR